MQIPVSLANLLTRLPASVVFCLPTAATTNNISNLAHLNDADKGRVARDITKLQLQLDHNGGQQAHPFMLMEGDRATRETRLVVSCGVCSNTRINTSLDAESSNRMMFSSFFKHTQSNQGHKNEVQRREASSTGSFPLTACTTAQLLTGTLKFVVASTCG